MSERLSEAQIAWFDAHPGWTFIGPPRPGVYFKESGTLYRDGRYVKNAPMVPIRLEPGCRGVGLPAPPTIGDRHD